ncbi:hypothetical protein IG631_14821 [Alternaria alternata]|nr:hypothetical protein IG631_14821 [Alternaria alternata]
MKINDAVCAIEKRLWLFEDDTMKCYAWRMYSQIFSFLGEVIRWYTKRSIQRLVSSFNENLLAFFDDQVEEIFKLSRLIHDEANLRGQADTQIIRLYQEGMNEKFDRFMIDLRERDRVQRDNLERQYDHFHDTLVERQRSELWSKEVLERALLDIWETIKRRETGDAVTEILEGDIQRGMESPRTPKTTRSVEFDGFRPQAITDASLGGSGRLETTRDSVALLSAHLEDYFDRVKVSIPRTRNDNGVFASSSVASRIKSWVMATESQILYTSGTDPLEEDRQTSDVASQYVLVARKAGIPVCSYSCSLQGINPPADRTRETIELVSLVYSVIRQLVELLPWHAALGTTWSDETPWTALDGTLDTFPQALEILGILLHATEHAIIVIIIDRFDLLDDPSYRSTESALKSLLDLLLRYTNSTKSPILKLWFISGGSSASLFEVLDVNQIAISSTYQRKAGRARLDDELIVL